MNLVVLTCFSRVCVLVVVVFAVALNVSHLTVYLCCTSLCRWECQNVLQSVPRSGKAIKRPILAPSAGSFCLLASLSQTTVAICSQLPTSGDDG